MNYVDENGAYVGTYVGTSGPPNTYPVEESPSDARDVWDFENEKWIKFIHPVVYPPLTGRQLRLGLLEEGIFTQQILEKIDQLPDGIDKERTIIEWEYSDEYHRDHHLISSMGEMLGLSEEKINEMWLNASKL